MFPALSKLNILLLRYLPIKGGTPFISPQWPVTLATLQGHQPSNPSASRSNVQAQRAAVSQPGPPTPVLPDCPLPPSNPATGLTPSARREQACHRATVTLCPPQASASRRERATHSRKRKQSGKSRCGTGLETTGFSRPGDSTCLRARRLHTISADEQAGTKSALHLSWKEAERVHRRPCQERGDCPALRPERGHS